MKPFLSVALCLTVGTVALAGCLGPPTPQATPSLILTPHVWGNAAINISIDNATSASGIAPSTLSYTAYDSLAVPVFQGAAGTQTYGTFSITITYIDNGNNEPSAGDYIYMRAIPEAGNPLAGGRLEVLSGTTVIGTTTLPP